MNRRPLLLLVALAITFGAAAPRASAQCDISDAAVGRPALKAARDADPRAFTVKRGFRGLMEHKKANRQLLESGELNASPDELARLTKVSGTLSIPVLMGRFSNTPFDFVEASDLQDILFDSNPTGTLSAYWSEVSYGALTVTGTVREWVDTSLTRTEIAGGSQGTDVDNALTGDYIHQVIGANDGACDFGQFDNDGPDNIPNSGDDDGYVDFLAIVHPDDSINGNGKIRSHRYWLSYWEQGVYQTNDARHGGGQIMIDDYVLLPSRNDDDGGPTDIGVYCHEFGHGLGLPDLYDTDDDDEDSQGIGGWGLMGRSHKNDPQRPGHLSAWSKIQLGWMTAGFVVNDLVSWPLLSSSVTPAALRLWKDGTVSPLEYFLVEYRRQVGFDDSLPGEGLLIWHVDERKATAWTGNEDESYKFLDLECADQFGPDNSINGDHLDNLDNNGDAGDPFCSAETGGVTFAPWTTPSSNANNGAETGVQITGIFRCGQAAIIASYLVGNPQPLQNFCMRDCGSDSCFEPSPCENWWASPDIFIDNNEDGIIDPPAHGLENKLFANVFNVGSGGAANVTVDFYQSEAAAGLLWPGNASLIGSANIPVIGAFDSEKAGVLWNLPEPAPDIDHWCIGAIATNTEDGQTDPDAIWDNNLAQINVQELFAKAGDQAPIAATEEDHIAQHAGDKAAQSFFVTRTVKLCNYRFEFPCNAELWLGSPPNFDDVVLSQGVDVFIDDNQFASVDFNECIEVEVIITDTDAHHLEESVIPLTMVCGGEIMGGVIQKVAIDNFPPKLTCDKFTVVKDRFDGDAAPMHRGIRIEWEEEMEDEEGWADRVERWQIYRGSTLGFKPHPSNLILETCIDDEPGSLAYQHLGDPPPDPWQQYYKIRAIDRAGNSTTSCAKLMDPGETLTGLPELPLGAVLEQNAPNPFNPSTQIRFQVPRAGEVDLSIFNARGERVRTLWRGHREQGSHALIWDGKDATGARVASGVYSCRLVYGGEATTRQMLLLK